MRAIATLCLLLAAISPFAAAAEPPFIALKDTASPDGRHAFAWSLPAKFKVNWDSLVQGDDRVLPKNFEDHVLNQLVNLESHKVLATVPKAQAFDSLDGSSGNHRDLSIAWSPASDFTVAIYSLKWNYASATGAKVGKAGAAIVDLGKPLETAYRQQLSESAGARYASRKDRLAISFSELKADAKDGTFTVQANAEIPKSESDDDAFQSSVIHFTLKSDSAGKLAVTIDSIKSAQ
jgi:hypothetical protein